MNASTRWPVLAMLALTVACGGKPPEAAKPLASRIELAAGDVKAGAPDGLKPAGANTMLGLDSVIEVGAGGRCLLRLSDGSGAFLREGTRIALQEKGVALSKGEAWFEVPALEDDLFVIAAGQVKVAAEKAGLDVRVAGDQVKVIVIRGLAVVESPAGRTEVSGGESAILAGGSPPKVGPLDYWDDWTGGMADHSVLASGGGRASGRIYAIDRLRPGSPPQDLQIREQVVRVRIQDGIARTEVTQTFFNPSSSPVEGWYWFTIPEGAAVTRFAIVVDGQVVDGEVIERKQAAAAYEEAIRKAFDPALLEWVDGRTFRARIYPVPPTGDRRVILAYSEILPKFKGVTRYLYPMGQGEPTKIQEFSLVANLGDEKVDVVSVPGARLEDDGKKVTMRRSGFTPHGDFLLELRDRKPKDALRVIRYPSVKEEADYLMVRYSPEEDFDALPAPEGVVVVVVDTSAGGDETDRKIRNDAAEAVLRALSAGDRFAVMAVDIVPRLVYPATEGLAAAEEKNIAQAMEKLSEVPSSGATDLGDVFNQALKLVHGASQPAVLYIGDGRATVGETKSAELVERLKRSLSGSRARFFTLAVGVDANLPLLDRLSTVGGGAALRVDLPEQAVQQAMAFVGAVKTPTITDLKFDLGAGIDQVFSTGSGKVTRGQEVFVFGRTHHPLPDKVKVTGALGGKTFERSYDTAERKGREFAYVAPLWAMQYLRFLMGTGAEENRGQIIALGLEFSLMTPYSSFLVLESNQAYQQQGIKRRTRHPVWGFAGDGTAVAEADPAFEVPFLLGCSKRSSMAGAEPTEPQVVRVRQEEGEKSAQASSPAGTVSAPPPAAAPHPAALPPAPAKSASRVKEEATERKVRASAIASILTDRDEAGKIGGGGSEGEGGELRGDKGVGSGGGGLGYGGRTGDSKKDKALPGAVTLRQAGGDDRPAVDQTWIADLTTGRNVVLPQAGEAEEENARKAMMPLEACSDASMRPLAVRRGMWERRLAGAFSVYQAVEIYRAAGRACELDGWKAERAMLDLVLSAVRTPGDMQALLQALGNRPKVANYLRQELLKRVALGMTQLPTGINWYAVDAILNTLKDPQARLAELRKVLAFRPQDPEGLRRLLYLLLDLGAKEEALAVASRLRAAGISAPALLMIVGDLLAEKGDVEGSRRAYSEIVEHNPTDPKARRMLGDVFLRHGWYDDAYRQYGTLMLLGGGDPVSTIRLALAAAGAGRTDEALRLFKKVLEMGLEPGPSDPRQWAKLWSAAALARLMAEASKANDAEKVKVLERGLKRTELFGSPATLSLLTWEDLDAVLALTFRRGDAEVPVGDVIPAPETGLIGAWLPAPQAGAGELTPVVDWGLGKVNRKVAYHLLTIRWDGKEFRIDDRPGTLEPKPQAAIAKGE